MRRRPYGPCLAVCLALSVAVAAPVGALVGNVEGPIGIDGSIRTIGAGIRNYGLLRDLGADPADALSQSLLRLTALGRVHPRLSYEVHAVQTVTYTSGSAIIPAAPFGLVGASDLRYRALDASWIWHANDTWSATFLLDRFNAKLALPGVDVTVGRQAITLGKAYFWNPLDVFLAFDPQQFDQDYKPGVDAVRVQLPLGRLAGVDVIGVAGRTLSGGGRFVDGDAAADASWFGSALLGRVFATVRGWDVTAQGGKIYGGEQVGAGAVGEAGPLEIRAEVAHVFADESQPLLPDVAPGVPQVEDGTSVVIGIGHRFESSLTLEAEWFRNGAGDHDQLDASLVRFVSGGSLDPGEYVLGASVTYDILPILVGQLAGLVSLDDGSAQLQPRLTWSAADEVEVLAGAVISCGDRPDAGGALGIRPQSAYGTFPDVFYVEAKLYF